MNAFGWFFRTSLALSLSAALHAGYLALVALALWQGLVWLGSGSAPERDLFWLLADTACPATEGRDIGWIGKDVCRSTNIIPQLPFDICHVLAAVCDWHLSFVYVILLGVSGLVMQRI